jgi:hypothetical protein
MPLATQLHFTECRNLKRLPDFPIATSFVCQGGLAVIPIMPLVTFVNVAGCSNVAKIPFMAHLTFLNCSSTSVDYIPCLPNLVKLECCDADVECLPFLPNLKDLKCSHNSKLTMLPVAPRLESLDVTESTRIRDWSALRQYPVLKALVASHTNIGTDDVANMPTLQSLSVEMCKNFTSLSGLQGLKKLIKSSKETVRL